MVGGLHRNLIRNRILTVGPTFQLDAEATAALTGDLSLSVDLAYSVSNGKLFFPPSAGSSSGSFAPANSSMFDSMSIYVIAEADIL